MREILFRAWDKVSKKYREFDGMHDTMTINEDGKVEYYNLQNGSGGDEYILEQFTGLLDKNGKKIFEGDILNLTYPLDNYTVVCEVVWEDESSMYVFKDIKGNTTSIYAYSKIEVVCIGNIHDNPEVMGVEK